MSISNNIVALLSDESLVHPTIVVGYRSLSWLDLLEGLKIQPTPKEKQAWQQDIDDVENNIPSQIEMILSSALTPSGRRFRGLFAPQERKKLSQGILLEQTPFVPYIPSNSGAQNRAESYVTYLRILHDYMKYVNVFPNLKQEMNPLYGWRKKTILNGCLVYRKLVEAGKIQVGEKLSLDKNFSRIDLLALTGRHENGKQMSLTEQVAYINNMVQNYEKDETRSKKCNKILSKLMISTQK